MEDIQEDLPSISSKQKISPKLSHRPTIDQNKELSAENMKSKDIELINAIIDSHKQQYKPSVIRGSNLENTP